MIEALMALLAAVTIVTPENPTPVERFAAEELADGFKRMTGRPYAVVSEDAATGSSRIYVGATRAAAKATAAAGVGKWRDDEVFLKRVADGLVVTGDAKRGPLYAADLLLEDHYGVRWWSPTESDYPHRDRIELPATLDVRYAPPLKFRESFFLDNYDPLFKVRGKNNVTSRTKYVLPPNLPKDVPEEMGGQYSLYFYEGRRSAYHSFFEVLPPKRHFDAHPEWYSLVGGKRVPRQLCVTNPEMTAAYIAETLRLLREKPETTCIQVSQNDWNGACECDRCKAVAEEEGAVSGAYLRFVNEVAAAIAKEFPAVTVDTFAYRFTRKAPKKVRPAANVVVRLCDIECAFDEPLATSQHELNRAFVEDLEAWQKVAAGHLYIWDYLADFWSYVMPHPNLRTIAPNIRFFADHGAIGVFAQGDALCSAGDFTRLKQYVTSHMLWNPRADGEKFVREFLEGYYGKAAAKPLRQYWDIVFAAPSRNWKAHVRRVPVTCYHEDCTAWMTEPLAFRALTLMDEALAAAEGNATFTRRIRRERLSIVHAVLRDWIAVKAYAARVGYAWPLPESFDQAAREWLAACDEFGVLTHREANTFDFYRAYRRALGDTTALLPAEKVNCFIGTGGNGHCFPAATYPFGLVQAGPDTGWGTWDYCSGYRYEDAQITMFSQTHNPGGGCPDYADVGIMPFVGEDAKDVVSPFSHANETAVPGYYAVTLDKGRIRVEVSATEHASIYRITPGEMRRVKLLVDLDYGMGNLTWAKKKVTPLKVERLEGGRIRAHLLRDGFVWHRHIGADLRFDPAPTAVEELPKEAGVHAPKYVLTFDVPAGRPLFAKCGLSATDEEGATRNLAAEIPGWAFDDIRYAARKKWNEVLSRIEVSGADADRTAMFMTAVYRMFHTPTNIADVDGRYRGGDEKLSVAPNGRYYSEFSLWDTFRGAHPAFTIVASEYVPDFVNSLLAHHRAAGFLPVLPKWGRDSQCMIATHAVAVIADAYFKGFKGVDWNAAFDAVRATLRERHPTRRKEQWDLLDRYGYYPCDELKGEGVSRTLECSYDDWCAWKMAEALGRKEDAAFFRHRAGNWTNVLDRSTGFMRGRLTTGAWREPFDPYRCGHEVSWAGDFTEGNAWQWRWHVLQDPVGLVDALGGKEKTAALLDELFTLPSELDPTKTSLDVTGLLGQYVQGNEPSHHIPYLYQYAGRPDRAAERIRDLCDKFYFNKPDGLCGNEDHGEMSAWYVFACLGFYPVNPSSGEYVIGAPQVPQVTLRLDGTKTFAVVARNLSEKNRYVKAVKLNGKPLKGFVLRHADIMSGGELVFEMSAENPHR